MTSEVPTMIVDFRNALLACLDQQAKGIEAIIDEGPLVTEAVNKHCMRIASAMGSIAMAVDLLPLLGLTCRSAEGDENDAALDSPKPAPGVATAAFPEGREVALRYRLDMIYNQALRLRNKDDGESSNVSLATSAIMTHVYESRRCPDAKQPTPLEQKTLVDHLDRIENVAERIRTSSLRNYVELIESVRAIRHAHGIEERADAEST